jgi:hypothetical protein
MLCRFAIKSNVFISTIKTVRWIEENLLLPPLRGWPQPYIEVDYPTDRSYLKGMFLLKAAVSGYHSANEK